MSLRLGLLPALFIFCPQNTFAEVVTAKENGFKIVQNYELNSNASDAFKEIIKPKNWWNSSHTWSQDSNNLYIEAKAGGCFCEKLPNNGSALHMNIVYIKPNEELRMFGALGPMQFSGSSGHLILKLTPNGKKTNLQLSFIVGGYYEGGLDKLAPMADKMLSEQFSNYKKYIETK